MNLQDIVKKKIGMPLRLSIKVTTRGARTECLGILADGTIRVRLAAVPEDGRANAELVRYIAEEIGCRESQVSIVSGYTSTRKILLITD